MKKITVLLMITLFTVSFAIGQTTYKGKVMTNKGKDAITSVMLNGVDAQGKTVVTARSDAKGKFEITLPAGCNRIEVTKEGYSPRTIQVSKKKKLKIKMMPQ
jgi:Carboxypeptidase regulatory-like domain